MTSFRVQHHCPQCGADIEFAETDHLLICPFCDVRNFMWTPHYLRFVFHPRVNEDGDRVVFAPYLHFKGNVFFARGPSLERKVLEFTSLGLVSKALPTNLGWKTQTQPLSLLHKPPAGQYLKFALKPSDMLRTAIVASTGNAPPFQSFIGEMLSLIYFPLVARGPVLLDGITGDIVARLPPSFDFGPHALERPPRADLNFIPAVCPTCGWALDGEGRSLGLLCDNCDSAWEPIDGRLQPRPVATAHTRGGQYVYLPFWRMSVRFTAPALATFGDLLSFTNQHAAGVAKDAPLQFWAPAFKINAQSLLRLCLRPTIAQHPFPLREDLPRKHRYPVTLSSKEAAETLPLTLAELTMNKRDFMPQLDRVRHQVDALQLVYLPFNKAGAEVIQTELNLALNPQALAFGRYL